MLYKSRYWARYFWNDKIIKRIYRFASKKVPLQPVSSQRNHRVVEVVGGIHVLYVL